MGQTDTAIGYTVKPDVVARSIADEMILLDLETGTYFTLNSVGRVMWRGLETGSDRGAIVAAVVDQFEVDVDTATADFDEYVESLTSEGLLVT